MAEIRQYVNLPGATGNLGNTINLRVNANQVPNVHPGDRVDWWIDADPGNEQLTFQSNSNAPPAGTVARTRLAHGPAPGTTSGSDHFFTNTLTLTQIGGDKYAVKASRQGQRGNAVRFPADPDWLQTWRKLFYTVWYSDNETLRTVNNLEAQFVAEFARHFIELERKALIPTLVQVTQARLDMYSLALQANNPTNILGDWRFMNGGPNAVMSLRAYGAPAAAATLSDKPLHMALLMVPQVYDTSLESWNVNATRNMTGSVTTFERVWNDPTLNGNFMYTAQASWHGHGATDVRSYFTNAPGVTPRSTDVKWDLRTLPGLSTHLNTAANNFRLRFSYVTRSSINGYSWGNFCVVGCTFRTENAILGTFVHEMGHGVAQSVQDERIYDAGTGVALATRLANPMWYDNYFGGVGPHCHTNAGLTPDPSTASGQRYDWWPALGPSKLCTIYHAGHDNRDNGVFCPSCAPRIRRLDLRTPTRGAGTWRDFG